MAREIKRMYDEGYVTARDRSQLGDGAMQQATGVYYKPGNRTDIHKLDGRSEFGDTGTSAKVGGVKVALFDSGGTAKLLALSNGVLYGATPGATGTFSSLYTLTGSGATLDMAHANDRHYLAMDSENLVLESDGTTRAMGMDPPAAALTVAAQAAGDPPIDLAPSAGDSGWEDMANAYDSDSDTSSYASRVTAGSTVGIWSGFATNEGTGRTLQISWSLDYGGGWADFFEKWNTSGEEVDVKIEYSEDAGTNYTTILDESVSSQSSKQIASVAITDTTVDADQVWVRATLTFNSLAARRNFRIYSIKILDGGASNDYSAAKLTYAYTEWDDTTKRESVPSNVACTAAFSSKASVRVTLPATAINSATTHLRIYRTPDNGTVHQLGYIGIVAIGQTTFEDIFEDWEPDEQPVPTVSYIEFEADGQTIRNPRDFPPPTLKRVFYYRGGLVGLSSNNPRGVFYSLPGLPESWPREYFLDAIPLEEHDELLNGLEVGGSAILAATGAMIRIDEFPQSVGGIFIAGEAVAIKGAPGCVGAEAIVAVNYRGQSHAAWLSPENGILVTDGHKWDSIGDDIDWTAFDGYDKSGWALTYYKHLRILRLDYSTSTSGGNNRFMLFHIDKDHVKTGGIAKVTGPHYGAASALAAVQYANTTRIYSAHVTDGKVYLEHDSSTGADASNAYDVSSTNPLIIKGPRRYDAGWRTYTALSGRLYHGDFGTGQTVTLAYETGRDSSDASSTASKTVSVSGNKGTQFEINKAGEWHEETITHTGTGRSHIGNMSIRARVRGEEGTLGAA